MIRKFSNHGDALQFGSDFSKANSCHVWCKSVYLEPGKLVSIVFGPSSAHLSGGHCCDCTPWGGWYFGGAGVMADSEEGKRLLALAEIDPLPNNAERWYGIVAGHTCGFTPDQMREIATEAAKNDTSVWHESNALHNRTNPDNSVPCPCAKCKTPKKGDVKPKFYRGRV